MTEDTKWRHRARLERWAAAVGAAIEFRSAGGYWTVTATVQSAPGVWIVSSDPRDSIESACLEVIERFAAAGHEVE